MTTADITVCTAHIPIRETQLQRAHASVMAQTLLPANIIVELDSNRTGAGPTKNRAVERATTEWVAILDDDDELMPHHLADLYVAAMDTGADVVYADPYRTDSPDGMDPNMLPGPFDPDELRRRSYIQTTALIRRQLLLDAGGFQIAPGSIYDDWGGFLALLDAGAVFHHHEKITWIWHVELGQNTSGRGDRW